MDVDKTLEWKQSLVFVLGLFLTFAGLYFCITFPWVGIPLVMVGLFFLMANIKATIASDHEKAVKIALLVPKVTLFIILLLVSLLLIYAGLAIFFQVHVPILNPLDHT